MNADGKVDLVTTNSDLGGFNQSLTSLLGNGDGTFQPHILTPISITTISMVTSAALGQFDTDGKMDLGVATALELTFLNGNGDGTFEAWEQAEHVSFAGNAFGMISGDADKDGKTDLLVANGGIDVKIYYGKGDGTFEAPLSHPTGIAPQSVALHDLNSDGNLDLVSANLGSNDVSVLLGQGSRAFATNVNYPADEGCQVVAVGDIDADQKLDIAVANLLSHNVSALRGNGDGTFQPATTVGTGPNPRGLVLADFNGDGRDDAAATQFNGNSLVILLGQADGTLKLQENIEVGDHPSFVVTADFNGDGKPDLALSEELESDVRVFLAK
jgi:hypothetical protein